MAPMCKPIPSIFVLMYSSRWLINNLQIKKNGVYLHAILSEFNFTKNI